MQQPPYVVGIYNPHIVQNHFVSRNFSNAYGMLINSTLKINKGEFKDPVALLSYVDGKPIDFKYNFMLELETISQIDEEKTKGGENERI